MPRSGKPFVAGLLLALWTAAGTAAAFERDPVSGGLLAVPPGEAVAPAATAPPEPPAAAPVTPVIPAAPPATAPVPPPVAAPVLAPAPAQAAPTAEPAPPRAPGWGLLVRGGTFGLPDLIADELFFAHPDVVGSSFGAEIRYNGAKGRREGTSVGLAVESARAKTDGVWQQRESDKPVTGKGEVSMLAITLTRYWYLFPTWYLHPYLGLGIGAAHVKGNYTDDKERIDADIWIPVLHVPIGLAAEFGDRFQLSAEARFIDGIAVGGALQVRF